MGDDDSLLNLLSANRGRVVRTESVEDVEFNFDRNNQRKTAAKQENSDSLKYLSSRKNSSLNPFTFSGENFPSGNSLKGIDLTEILNKNENAGGEEHALPRSHKLSEEENWQTTFTISFAQPQINFRCEDTKDGAVLCASKAELVSKECLQGPLITALHVLQMLKGNSKEGRKADLPHKAEELQNVLYELNLTAPGSNDKKSVLLPCIAKDMMLKVSEVQVFTAPTDIQNNVPWIRPPFPSVKVDIARSRTHYMGQLSSLTRKATLTGDGDGCAPSASKEARDSEGQDNPDSSMDLFNRHSLLKRVVRCSTINVANYYFDYPPLDALLNATSPLLIKAGKVLSLAQQDTGSARIQCLEGIITPINERKAASTKISVPNVEAFMQGPQFYAVLNVIRKVLLAGPSDRERERMAKDGQNESSHREGQGVSYLGQNRNTGVEAMAASAASGKQEIERSKGLHQKATKKERQLMLDFAQKALLERKKSQAISPYIVKILEYEIGEAIWNLRSDHSQVANSGSGANSSPSGMGLGFDVGEIDRVRISLSELHGKHNFFSNLGTE